MEQPPPVSEMTPSAPTMALGARLFNVFAVPGEVFEQVKSAPVSHANWLVPALTLILVSWLGTWAIFSQPSIKAQLSDIAEKALQKQVEKGKLTKQQAESAQQNAEKATVIFGAVGAAIVPLFVAIGTPFWGGLIVWLVGAKVLKGNFTYMKGVEIAGLALMVGVLGEVVRILLVIVLGNLYASPSLVLLIKEVDPQSPLLGILAVFNVFLFWELAVRSIGLARISNAPFGKAAGWMFGIWAAIAALLIGIGQAVRIAFGG
jgi:hypothetical protein